MLTIEAQVEAEIEIKKSKFLATIARASSEDEARAIVAAARSANPAARHHCSAFVIGDRLRIERSSDDGEPSGTAGAPMLEVLRGHDLTNVAAVVTRYFGGTKLGTGGLARAYAGAVSEALLAARLMRREERELIGVELDHAEVGRIESELRGRGIDVISIDYAELALLTVAARNADEVDGVLASLTSGTARPERIGTFFREVPR
ncbi:YigZ family protein [Rhodococcus sp. G-MC3]|uniref:YigZ family protein n=1 Tax=Rhodococcus sp. G-MC3 TaxID=3046209 RepID=UPI0024BB79C8|nr:YigZ family protein [Rhodococcus sp. G-MC3]MDJ0394456.1 YigZ family protein [Rhodococcus sp. G-MC3]